VALSPGPAGEAGRLSYAQQARHPGGETERLMKAVRFSQFGGLIESGRFSLPVARTFPLAEVAEVHRASEGGHVRGKLVLVVGSA
jgi:NADPH:quinone reductase-like Zn-dependent oxidoreductase